MGGVCIFACLKCYQRSQTKRLTQANNRFEFQGQAPTTEPPKTTTEAPVVLRDDQIPDTEQIDTENDDFGQVLTSRGLVFQPPKERRQTFQKRLTPVTTSEQ